MRIAVYCSSRKDIPQKYHSTASIVGQWIGSHNASLIYGGMDLGLMKTVATSASNAGGRIVGVVPVKEKAMALSLNDEEVLAFDLNDRKAKLILLGDVFVVLAGGYGTLDELISTFSFLTFAGDTHKTIILVNEDGLYDPILSQLKLMIEQNLLSTQNMSRLKVVANAQECCQLLETLLPPTE